MSWLVLHVADKQEVRLLEENKGIRGLWGGGGSFLCICVSIFFICANQCLCKLMIM